MKKMIITIFLFFTFCTSNLFSASQNVIYSSNNAQWTTWDPSSPEKTFLTVITECNDFSCNLMCRDENINGETCRWKNVTWCNGCSFYENTYDESEANSMFEYAIDRIKELTYSGQYALHYVNPNNNIIYFRIVTWDHDVTTGLTEIIVSITFDDGL